MRVPGSRRAPFYRTRARLYSQEAGNFTGKILKTSAAQWPSRAEKLRITGTCPRFSVTRTGKLAGKNFCDNREFFEKNREYHVGFSCSFWSGFDSKIQVPNSSRTTRTGLPKRLPSALGQANNQAILIIPGQWNVRPQKVREAKPLWLFALKNCTGNRGTKEGEI